MENILVASSNLYGLRAIYKSESGYNDDRTIVLIFAMFSSIIYHLFECHKHQMPGLYIFPTLFRSRIMYHILINIDRFFAALSIYMLFDLRLIRQHILLITIALTCMTLSETVFRYEKHCYMVLHIIWHLLAFHLAYLFC